MKCNVGEAPKPGDLALGQLSCGSNSGFDKGFNTRLALQVVPGLAIANTPHAGAIGVQSWVLHQAAHFIKKSCGNHLMETIGNPVMQQGSVVWHECNRRELLGKRRE